jgi:hypothetical protein
MSNPLAFCLEPTPVHLFLETVSVTKAWWRRKYWSQLRKGLWRTSPKRKGITFSETKDLKALLRFLLWLTQFCKMGSETCLMLLSILVLPVHEK